jgi:hypothetical protein
MAQRLYLRLLNFKLMKKLVEILLIHIMLRLKSQQVILGYRYKEMLARSLSNFSWLSIC